MKVNQIASISKILIITLFVFVATVTQSVAQQTNEELKKEIEQLEERKRLFEKRAALKAEIEAYEKGQKPATSTTTNTDTTKTETKTANTTAAAVAESVLPIPGVKELFSKPNNTVIKSVCEQMRLSPQDYNIYDTTLCTLADQLVTSADTEVIFDHGETANLVAVLIAAKFAELPPSAAIIDADVKKFILDAENKRNDKQVGADAKAGGTTSLAVKGGIPQFLSWAVENGAAVGTQSGNTLTFRINPVGLLTNVSAATPFAGQSFASNFSSDDAFTRSLKNFSLGFSFDITRGNATPLFTGSKQQLSAFSVRYNFLNRKDPRNPIYKKDWEKFGTDVLGPYTEFAHKLFEKLTDTTTIPRSYKNPHLKSWRNALAKRLKEEVKLNDGKSRIELLEAVRAILAEEMAKFPTDKLKADTDLIAAVNENGKKLITYSKARKELDEKIAKGEVLSLEYTNYREVNAPDVSNIRFIAEKGFGSDWNLTANASVSFLNKMPTGTSAANVKRIRDFDFTLQLEKPLMELSFGRPIFSFAGQWQRLQGNIVGPDGVVKPNTKGDTAVGQFKLVIPINGTGIKLPFSLTFANRSELVKESTVRGNFGFTFDVDRLLFGRKLF